MTAIIYYLYRLSASVCISSLAGLDRYLIRKNMYVYQVDQAESNISFLMYRNLSFECLFCSIKAKDLLVQFG